MNNYQVQELKALSLNDMECIHSALEAQVRATQKLLHEHIEPAKDNFPTLYGTYQRQLASEKDLLQRFNEILSQLY